MIICCFTNIVNFIAKSKMAVSHNSYFFWNVRNSYENVLVTFFANPKPFVYCRCLLFVFVCIFVYFQFNFPFLLFLWYFRFFVVVIFCALVDAFTMDGLSGTVNTFHLVQKCFFN